MRLMGLPISMTNKRILDELLLMISQFHFYISLLGKDISNSL